MNFRITLGLGLVIVSGVWNLSQGQQLREAFRKVEQAVVIVRTAQKELAPYPQEGMVSLNGLGSGVLVSSDGKVLTAAHLVEAADAIVVEFGDGTVIPARVMGTTDSADVALLQLERPPQNLAPATLADSDRAAVGDEIFVVGAPYGLSHTLTAGHISGRYTVNRGVENTIVEFLQTDAAVNRGNSGSPLFSLDGEVIGIVSKIMSTSGGSEGLAFAASSNTTRRLLLEQKPFWSGIEGLLVDGNLAQALNLPQPAGVLVQRVAEGSLAWRWGIHAGTQRANVEGQELILGGDIILGVNDVPVEEGGSSCSDIYASVSKLKPGDNLVIKLFRRGQTVKLSLPVAP
jgi:S1-C subfamily serine protease